MRRFLVPVVAALALVAGACGGGGDDSPGQIVRAAATRTTEGESSRIELTMRLRGGAQEGDVSATGLFDYDRRLGAITMEMSGLGTIEAILDDTVYFMKFPPELAGQIPGGKPWVRIDLAAVGEQAGVDVSRLLQASQTDPRQTLRYLRGASDDVTEVGEEVVRGTDTMHYRATLDLRKAAAEYDGEVREAMESAIDALGTDTMPVDVWIDDEGRARKVELTQDMTEVSGGQVGTAVTTIELFDFGVDVDVEPPPADQVADLGALLGAG